MAFSRRFPRDVSGSHYPVWEEVYLSKEEEAEIEQQQREHAQALLAECIADARRVVKQTDLDEAEVCRIAIALFEKRASHAVYWKEERTKEKFDKAYRPNAP